MKLRVWVKLSVVFLHINGIVAAIYKEYTEITGVKEEDIVGKHMQDVWKDKGFDSETAFAVLNQDKKKPTADMLDMNAKNTTMEKPRPVSLIRKKQR